MKDKAGREYAKLSQIKKGDMVEIADNFTCSSTRFKLIYEDKKGTYFACKEGNHYLVGQADNGEDLVGIYSMNNTE